MVLLLVGLSMRPGDESCPSSRIPIARGGAGESAAMIGVLVLGMALGEAFAQPDLVGAFHLTAAHGIAELVTRIRGEERGPAR